MGVEETRGERARSSKEGVEKSILGVEKRKL
jgi:hypothetical protein